MGTELLTIFRGDDVEQQFFIQKNNLPVNLSTALQITISLLKEDGACRVASKTNGRISVSSTLGVFLLTLSGSDTDDLQVSTQPTNIDIVIQDSTGKNQTFRCPNSLMVLERVC